MLPECSFPMFYAVFLVTLPMSLREHINEYLGNRPEILIQEAKIFHGLVNQLYPMLFEVTNELYFYVSLPTREFRDHLFDLHELRLEFADCLRPLGIFVFGYHSVHDNNTGNRDYSKFLSCHNQLFSRTVSRIVAIINFLRQLHHQGKSTFLGDGEPEAVCQLIGQLRAANCRRIFDQLLPRELAPLEVIPSIVLFD